MDCLYTIGQMLNKLLPILVYIAGIISDDCSSFYRSDLFGVKNQVQSMFISAVNKDNLLTIIIYLKKTTNNSTR